MRNISTHEHYCYVDDNGRFAYWVDNGIMRAPIIAGDIDVDERELLDFDTISLNPRYYIHILDELESHR